MNETRVKGHPVRHPTGVSFCVYRILPDEAFGCSTLSGHLVSKAAIGCPESRCFLSHPSNIAHFRVPHTLGLWELGSVPGLSTRNAVPVLARSFIISAPQGAR